MLAGAYGTVFAADEVKTEKSSFFAIFEQQGAQITLLGNGLEGDISWECYDFNASKTGLVPGRWKTLVITGSGMIGPFKAEGLLPRPEGSLSDGKTPWGSYNDEIKTIFIEEGVTGIGEMAFLNVGSGCRIHIPESVVAIEDGAIGKKTEILGLPRSIAELYASQNQNEFLVIGEDALQGDMDGNGELDAKDALDVLKMVVGMEPLYKWTGDANHDQVVTAEDALEILKEVVGIN